MNSNQKLLATLPKVDVILSHLESSENFSTPRRLAKIVIRRTIERERETILAGGNVPSRSLEEWLELVKRNIRKKQDPNLKRIINGTGVVVHTNLGRSILSRQCTESLTRAGGFYSNLEFDLQSGKRGSRYSLVEELICDLTGAEAAIVVNNNAAAVLLALDTLAKDREVIVSRGQLVEIGGSFRIPDVMKKSGASLVEVGATNRTHLRDYENAITPETALLLRVHTSNFRIIGFTSDVSAEEMVELAGKKNLFTMEDLGSGCLVDLSRYGFPKEPTVQEIVKAGVDVVTFSGDKLLGGPQAGIIVGCSEVIQKIKENPLNRALRIDKFTLSSLESVLREYYDTENALAKIPTLAMLTIENRELKKRALRIQRRLKKTVQAGCDFKIVSTVSRVGGGALPEYSIPSWAVELVPEKMKLSSLEKRLRDLEIPVIGRIENEHFLLDIRTVGDHEVVDLVGQLEVFFKDGEKSD
ncbi:L-seryl-tRNA(Sec) selenium transferase [Desulfomarina profundi]|uniref:L-seryl-tRNA(Sec) selenium transferase n=1 Tax=Desulfomarina profundi TaxID=2772557 RepID=A0A8D5FFA1_9BACT|nr:L-seryl-tRNA(Sec) selenium transferase [Desulfomarina profundi]BCL60253.1 L-seryl-tRNA(Sec) selenium transferase [Desulfomarina profundi]